MQNVFITEQDTIITREQCDDKINSEYISWGKICHCYSNYMMVNGHCVKGKIIYIIIHKVGKNVILP